METLLTPSNIMFSLGIVGLAFTIWEKVTTPQAESQKTDALMAQQMKFFIDGTERRFAETQDSFNSLLLQSNNHIQTVDTKVEGLTSVVGAMGNEITKLATIIEERIPSQHL